jgi:hypothetical protein
MLIPGDPTPETAPFAGAAKGEDARGDPIHVLPHVRLLSDQDALHGRAPVREACQDKHD